MESWAAHPRGPRGGYYIGAQFVVFCSEQETALLRQRRIYIVLEVRPWRQTIYPNGGFQFLAAQTGGPQNDDRELFWRGEEILADVINNEGARVHWNGIQRNEVP